MHTFPDGRLLVIRQMSVEATAPLQNAAPNPPPVILIVPQPPILCRFYWMGCRELGSICCGGAALNTANGPWCRGVGVTMVRGGGVWGVMRMGMDGYDGEYRSRQIFMNSILCQSHVRPARQIHLWGSSGCLRPHTSSKLCSTFTIYSQIYMQWSKCVAYENCSSSLLVQNHDLMGFNLEGLDYLKLYASVIHTMRHLWQIYDKKLQPA